MDAVRRAQELGVPMARYNSPAEVLADTQERARDLFQPVAIPGVGMTDMLVSPFHFDGVALCLANGPPRLGEHQSLVRPFVAAPAFENAGGIR